MLPARSVNHGSPPPLQPQIYEACRREARCWWSRASVPAPRSHSLHQACARSLPTVPSVPSEGNRAHLSPVLTGSLGTELPQAARESPVHLRCRSQGSWEEANATPPLLAQPTRVPAAGDAGACSKAAPAWLGEHINYSLFSRGCPLLCRNQCLA